MEQSHGLGQEYVTGAPVSVRGMRATFRWSKSGPFVHAWSAVVAS